MVFFLDFFFFFSSGYGVCLLEEVPKAIYMCDSFSRKYSVTAYDVKQGDFQADMN